jgi:CRP/FNR family transcriptional regulator
VSPGDGNGNGRGDPAAPAAAHGPGSPAPPRAGTPAAARAELLAAYPSLADVPGAELDAALDATPVVDVPRGTVLFREGDPCRAFPFVLEGDVRVARGTPEGRSIELYRVGPGEVCLLSTSCAFSSRMQAAHAIAAVPTRLWPAPPETFIGWMARPAFRRFVFGVFGERLADLMGLAEAVAFQRMDQRLAAALLGHGRSLQVTHQRLADEVGTVREIVSRLLKRFEQRGWIALAREQVTILDAGALRALAEGGTAATD